jgi:hypothetical protein
MSENFGNGVSRTLSAKDYQFGSVVWQMGRPPLDSELNLISQIASEYLDKLSEAGSASGWLGNPLDCEADYLTDPRWSNFFRFGPQIGSEKRGFPWAIVNGWVVPVVGTRVPDGDYTNKVLLAPPTAASEARIDFVFLEVWQALLAPKSTVSKPTATTVYRFGNVEFGGTNLPDTIQDDAIGFETTRRVQVQYRIRTVPGINLATSNDGFDTNVFGWGTTSADPSSSGFTYSNMRDELGDPGLWRAGDGTSTNYLGTVDGYSYAIPICVTFRRNSLAYAVTQINGATNRNPAATTRLDAKEFTVTPTLALPVALGDSTITLVAFADTGLPPSGTVMIGDEIMTVIGVTGNVLSVTRAQGGSIARIHSAGDTVTLQANRPDGLFSDQVVNTDILDLRHLVGHDVDYRTLLTNNLNRLAQGQLATTWKQTGLGNVQGPYVEYLDRLGFGLSPSTSIGAGDNHRILWSDAAVTQPGNIIVCKAPASSDIPTQCDENFILTAYAEALVASANHWGSDDSISIRLNAFNTVPNSVRFVSNTEKAGSVILYREGEDTPIDPATFTVAPTAPTVSDDLVITLGSTFPTTTKRLIVSFTLQYSPGYGLSHTPSAINEFTIPSSSDTMTRYGDRLNFDPLALSGQVNRNGFGGMYAKYSEAYAELGSRTVAVNPYRRLTYPTLWVTGGSIMPTTGSGSAPKAIVDPLNLFTHDRYVSFPTSWAALPRLGLTGLDINIPILPRTKSSFSKGLNFFIETPEGTPSGLGTTYNFIPLVVSSGRSYQVFSTTTGAISATYNRTITPASGWTSSLDGACGIAKYNNVMSGRRGLQMPPFYGISRLWGVYLASEYNTTNRPTDATTRADSTATDLPTNLLRSDYNGPSVFVIQDSDGDATFILNADALDMSRITGSPDFMTQEFIVEASVFGFTRGFMNTNYHIALTTNPTPPSIDGTPIAAPSLVLTAPIASTHTVYMSYGRVPYQGTSADLAGASPSIFDSATPQGQMLPSRITEVTGNPLAYDALTRTDQKSFEVLDGVKFFTTVGSGSFSMPLSFYTNTDIGIGYENPTEFPTPVGAVPRVLTQALNSTNFKVKQLPLSNVTDRMPLGAFFADHDFLAESIGGRNFVIYDSLDITNIGYSAMSDMQGYAKFSGVGDLLAVLAGNSSTWTDVDRFRAERGGSCFVASNPNPGGPLDTLFDDSVTLPAQFNSSVMFGIALLVRNYRESYNSNDVSPGDELQMLIITQSVKPNTFSSEVILKNSSTGIGEGYSAIDRYRIKGHPLAIRRTRYIPALSAMTLAKKDF